MIYNAHIFSATRSVEFRLNIATSVSNKQPAGDLLGCIDPALRAYIDLLRGRNDKSATVGIHATAQNPRQRRCIIM